MTEDVLQHGDVGCSVRLVPLPKCDGPTDKLDFLSVKFFLFLYFTLTRVSVFCSATKFMFVRRLERTCEDNAVVRED